MTEHTDSPVDPEALAGVLAAIRDYRDRGAFIAVDDWGSGFSDMDRLELLQPEIVKIDMSIVQDLESAHHRALLGSVLAWSARRDAQVCAEGIETEDQLDRLRQLGVHLGQGFRIGRPEQPEQDADPGRLTRCPLGCSPKTNSGTPFGAQKLSRYDSTFVAGAVPLRSCRAPGHGRADPARRGGPGRGRRRPGQQ